jgi:hypothetical protein
MNFRPNQSQFTPTPRLAVNFQAVKSPNRAKQAKSRLNKPKQGYLEKNIFSSPHSVVTDRRYKRPGRCDTLECSQHARWPLIYVDFNTVSLWQKLSRDQANQTEIKPIKPKSNRKTNQWTKYERQK